jgi:hypothetical protein
MSHSGKDETFTKVCTPALCVLVVSSHLRFQLSYLLHQQSSSLLFVHHGRLNRIVLTWQSAAQRLRSSSNTYFSLPPPPKISQRDSVAFSDTETFHLVQHPFILPERTSQLFYGTTLFFVLIVTLLKLVSFDTTPTTSVGTRLFPRT